jgi:hypothetical protein
MRRAILDKKHSALAKSFLRPLIQFGDTSSFVRQTALTQTKHEH